MLNLFHKKNFPFQPLTAIDFDNTDSEVITDDDVITYLRGTGHYDNTPMQYTAIFHGC